MALRYLVLSDIHGDTYNLKKILSNETFNAILVAGDVSGYDGRYEHVISLLNSLSRSGVKVVMVLGNMDEPKLLKIINQRFPGITCLHGSTTRLHNYVVVGVSGALYSPFNTPFEVSEEELSNLLRSIKSVLSKNRREEVILLTHSPPYNTVVDKTYTGLHVGSKSIKRFIEEHQPMVAISGHIHEARGIDRVGRTLIVNPGPVYKGFYAILTILGRSLKAELKKVH